MSLIPSNIDYNDPFRVDLYDTINPFAADTQFYLDIAEELGVHSILDLGCGTGILTCAYAKNGYTVIGVDPSEAMLRRAQSKPYAAAVQWIQGEAQDLQDLSVDLAVMTGHVVQVFLDDHSWREVLHALHRNIRPGGYLVFESRNPAQKIWETWSSENIHTVHDPVHGAVDIAHELVSIEEDILSYITHYHVHTSGQEFLSENLLRFPSQEYLEQSLLDAGFSIQNVYGYWDRSLEGKELIFVVKKQ